MHVEKPEPGDLVIIRVSGFQSPGGMIVSHASVPYDEPLIYLGFEIAENPNAPDNTVGVFFRPNGEIARFGLPDYGWEEFKVLSRYASAVELPDNER